MMRSVRGGLGVSAVFLLLVMSSACALVAVDAGHEGVLVEKPFFFGHGGVESVLVKTSLVDIAPTA